MKMPTKPKQTMAELKHKDPECYDLVLWIMHEYIHNVGLDDEMTMEDAVEGLCGLFDSGWARIILSADGDEFCANIAVLDPVLGKYTTITGEVVEFDE